MNIDEQIRRVETANNRIMEEPSGDERAARLRIVNRIRELIIAIDIEIADGRQIKPIKEKELERLFSTLIPDEVA